MKSRRLCVPLLALLILASCAKITGDPVVVNAERSTSVSFDVIDSFLNFEHDNRAVIREKAPELHAFAETLREQAPRALKAARTATAVYKASRNPEDGQKAEDAVSFVETLARQAREAFLAAQKVTG
jgi:hypothetical protein